MSKQQHFLKMKKFVVRLIVTLFLTVICSSAEENRSINWKGFFMNSQMSYCMNKAVKPSPNAVPGAGGFVHCKKSIGKCIEDLLYCKTYGQKAQVTENISLAMIDVIGFYGNIDVDWRPPQDRTSLFYMARVWNISFHQRYSINLTAAEFNIAYTDHCRLDHLIQENLYSGSSTTMIDHGLWNRLCGKRSPFFLFSRNTSARLALYLESAGNMLLHYSPMVPGNIRSTNAEVEQSPQNTQTQEQPDGFFLKKFREKHYFWYLKGDMRAHFEIEYTVQFKTGGVLQFSMTIIDGPPVDQDMRTSHDLRTLLPEKLFRWNQKNRDKKISEKKKTTGFMAVISLVKLAQDKGNIPVVIQYTEEQYKKFSDYKARRPFTETTFNVYKNRRSALNVDITNELGTWHLRFVSPEKKFISVVLAVQRRGTPEHRELGVESKDCTYSGFAVYDDPKLLGKKPYLGPFCGKWWSTSDSWVKDVDNKGSGKIDWAHTFITSAQSSFNLMLYRYYDPTFGSKDTTRLRIFARTEDCPGQLITSTEKNTGNTTESFVNNEYENLKLKLKFEKCGNIFVYLQETFTHQLVLSIEPSDKNYIEAQDIRMSSREQTKRNSAVLKINPSLDFTRIDCDQNLEVETDSGILDANGQLQRHSTRLIFRARSQQRCDFLSHIFARFFLVSTDCRREGLSTITETGTELRRFTDPCGQILLPTAVQSPVTVRLELLNADVDFFLLSWSTEKCMAKSKLKFIVYLTERLFPVITLKPKSKFSYGSNANQLLEWKSSSNKVTIGIIISPAGFDLDCPITLVFTGEKYKAKFPPPQPHRTHCLVGTNKLKDEMWSTVWRNITWRQAEKKCQAQNGHLLDIHSAAFGESLRLPLTGGCQTLFESVYSAAVMFLGLHDLKQEKNHEWTSCKKAKYFEWRQPGRERATLVNVQSSESSLFQDPILREIWESRKEEPSKNKINRCTAMIVTGPNMDPKWVKIPCDQQFTSASVVCKKPSASEGKCNKELPTIDSRGNTQLKQPPQWNRNITCNYGWVMNPSDLKCYQVVAVTPRISEINLFHNKLANYMCKSLNGNLTTVGEENMQSIIMLLSSVKAKSEYGGIWIEDTTGTCSILIPEFTSQMQWKKHDVPCHKEWHKNKIIIASALCVQDPIPTKQLSWYQLHQCYDGAFVLKLHVCDGISNCRDGSDETDCEMTSVVADEKLPQHGLGSSSGLIGNDNCSPLYYRCDNSSQCVSWDKVCDGKNDCIHTASDELICRNNWEITFSCNNGQVTSLIRRCDLSPDCLDGTDETRCKLYNDVACEGNIYKCKKFDRVNKDMGKLRPEWIESLKRWGLQSVLPLIKCSQLSLDLHPCGSIFDGCYHKDGICVEDKLPNGVEAYCPDREHLQNCEEFVCPGKFKCDNSYCIPLHRVCDGTKNCFLGEDEINCDKSFCNSSFWCDGICISPENICDGIKQCHNGDDELLCDMECPLVCSCLAHAVECIGRNLTVSPHLSSKQIKALIVSRNFLNYSGIQNLGSSVLHQLITLDLSFNQIEELNTKLFIGKYSLSFLYLEENFISIIPEDCFKGLSNLRELHLLKNPLQKIQYKGFHGLKMLTNLDLSGMEINNIQDHAFAEMSSLQYMNLSLNRITFIGAHVFKDLVKLEILDLSGNSLLLIEPTTFQSLTNLESLHTDDYKFCCAALHVQDCLPKPDVYSSCDDLLSSDVLRAFIWLLGFFSLIGNVAVVCYRSQIEKPSVLSFLVHNLGIADFMMGIYLLIIASADAYYRGYYYLHDSYWRSHFVCRIAGFLSMLSSEMSVYVLVLITTDRVLSVGLGKKSFSDTTAKILTCTGWVVFIFLSLLPVTNIPYFGIDEYIQHGVCFLFNLTDGKVSGWEYATAIFICFNLFSLLYLAIGYSFTFIRVLTRAGISTEAEIQLARKLALVVLTDCICWIPPITIGIISLHDIEVDPQVSMWIAVFVFPINSSLNPFLYTFSTCGKKPDPSENSDPGDVTQMDKNECQSLSDDGEDYEHLEGAVGGVPHRPTKTVRFISQVDEMPPATPPPQDLLTCNSIDEVEDEGAMAVIEMGSPICRVNSADSGIEAFCIEYSPNGFSKRNDSSKKEEEHILDTHF